VTEGALGAALSGSQATSSTGAIVAAGNGNWSSHTPNSPWPGGVVPTASDAVVIPNGRTVTIDAQGRLLQPHRRRRNSGILRFAASPAETLAVGSSVLISPGASFSSAASGTELGTSFRSAVTSRTTARST
jgi:hypothetical protein